MVRVTLGGFLARLIASGITRRGTSGKAVAIPPRDGYGDGGWPTWR